jgi:hypothetical protein
MSIVNGSTLQYFNGVDDFTTIRARQDSGSTLTVVVRQIGFEWVRA